MIRFAHPGVLHFLWLLPFLVAASALFARRARSRLTKAFGGKASALILGGSIVRRRAKIGLAIAALAFFIAALARPQSGETTEKIKSEGVELIFAVDVSTSMLAEDVKPSRLGYAKAELTRLLDLLGGDKVGLIAFAGSATLLSPLTSDKSALKMFIESLSPQSVESQGTEFRKALREARSAFDRGGVDIDGASRVTRVVLLASDGEDQESGALEEARKLASDGTRVFTMAFGTERGAPIPLRDERGYLAGYKKDRSGQTIQTMVKGDFLRSLAEAGRGAFYHVSFGGQEAKAIRADIDKLEKTQFEADFAANFDERFQIPLFIGVMLAMAGLALGERGGSRHPWRGRFGTAAAVALSLACASVSASELGGAWDNNRGVSRFKSGKPGEAYKKFAEAVGALPESAQTHVNLGAAFAANKELERALEEYATAARMAKTPSELLQAAFGAGAVAGELKRVDEALDWYQQALDADPKNKETKTNIELLAQSQQGGSKGNDQKKDQKKQEGDKGDKPEQDKKDGSESKPEPESKPESKPDPKPDQKQAERPKPSPKPFDSKDISQQDVQKILEELKQQEGQIRARYQREGAKDVPRAKDW